MTRVLSIAAREIRERSFVFAAAGIMAFIPFLAALLPYARSGRISVIATGSLIVSTGFIFALSLVLGGSMVGREMSERRLSFYFSKPVSASAIWIGKVVAAFVTVCVCFAIIFLPSFVMTRGAWQPAWTRPGEFVAGNLVGAASLLLLAHAGATMVRSRSKRVAFDLMLLAAVAASIWLILRPLFAAFAPGLARGVTYFIHAGIFISLLLAGGWQLSRGRTDRERNHAELSTFLWTSVSVVLVLAALFVTWVFSAGPRDIEIRDAQLSPRGDWMLMRGRAHYRGDYIANFLVGTNGKSIRFDAARLTGGRFARNGDAVLTIAPVERGGRGELYVQRLDAPASRADTGISPGLWSDVVLSDDLRRVAILDGDVLSVHDLVTKSLLGSVRFTEPDGMVQMYFASPDVVRLYAITRPGPRMPSLFVRAFEFDLRNRRLQQTGELTRSRPSMIPLQISADGTTALVNRGAGTLIVADARTLVPRFSVVEGTPRLGILLRDGGVATLDFSSANAVLRIFDARGAHLRDVHLGPAKAGEIRELPGGKVLVNPWAGGRFDLYVVDLQRGAVERQERDFENQWQFRSPRDPRQPDMIVTQFLVRDRTGSLWRWDALTGAKTKVFG